MSRWIFSLLQIEWKLILIKLQMRGIEIGRNLIKEGKEKNP